MSTGGRERADVRPAVLADTVRAVDVEAVQVLTSLLALVAGGSAVVLLVARLFEDRSAVALALTDVARDAGLWLAFLVAAGSTLGSLYFSEVADYVPCRLCWFQRVAMYPLSVILLVAAWRRDRTVRWYVIPVAALGLAVSVYHSLIEWRPSLEGGACGVGPSCADVWFKEFGFVTLATMAGCGFLAIITLVALAGTERPTVAVSTTTVDQES